MEMVSDLEELRTHFKSHNRTREERGHSAKVHTVDWNRDGRRLASGSFDKTVCIYIVDNERLVGKFYIEKVPLHIFTINFSFDRSRNRFSLVTLIASTSSAGMKQIPISSAQPVVTKL